MTSYFWIRDDVINVLNFTRFLPIVYSYQVSASSDLNQKKNLKNLPLWSCFKPSTPPLIGYHSNNEGPILKCLILKDDLYNCLENFFEIFSKNPQGHFAPPPPPPSPNRVKGCWHFILNFLTLLIFCANFGPYRTLKQSNCNFFKTTHVIFLKRE